VVLRSLAESYGVEVDVSRDSPAASVTAAYKRVVLKVHPDKGGRLEDAQRLQVAKDAWDAAKKKRPGSSRNANPARAAPQSASRTSPTTSLAPADAAVPDAPVKDFRIRGLGVLLTYSGVAGVAQWRRYVAHVRERTRQWGLQHWCTTLEASTEGNLHMHCMLQFASSVSCTRRRFFFEKMKPNARPNDILGEGYGRRNLQVSLDRAFFYVWADKLGTQRDEAGAECTTGNYEPCWTSAARKYPVRGRWPESLWKAHKLGHAEYERYLYLCRDGVLSRKRNLDAVRDKEARDKASEEMAARVRRIRANPDLFRPFPEVPAAAAWLKVFDKDAFRYPLLVVVGPSGTGKTEWAKSLFKNALELKVGSLVHFPDRMRAFTPGTHDGLVLDDVRDLDFLVQHQEKLQGKYDYHVEFGSTPGGQLSYEKDS